MQIIVKPLNREALHSSIAQSVEHSAVNRSVVGSSPTWGVWGLSSAGRASALQAEGHRFEPCRPHFIYLLRSRKNTRLRGQVVKTSPFHGGNTSSSLVGVIHGDLAKW